MVRDAYPLPDGYLYAQGTTWLYELRYRQSGKNFCGAGAQGERFAIPLAGYYDESNTARADPNRVTFACTRGVMAKCYRWGYRPWLGPEMAQAHQACMRMAMADYCGDGRSWTRDATLIQRWDLLSPPVQPKNELRASMSFEAAWTPLGAACVARPRWQGLAEDFRRERCARKIPVCPSEQEALREPGAILLNASEHNVLK